MPSERIFVPITWSTAAFATVAAATTVASDAVVLNVADWEGDVTVYVNMGAAPASGDTVDVQILWNAGAITGAGDMFDSAKHGDTLMQFNLFGTSGENPAQKTVSLRTAAKGFKIQVRNNSTVRSITVYAACQTHRPG